jgi:hypothetical protein
MSHAEPEHAFARSLEVEEIRLKNNKLLLSSALHRAIHISNIQNSWPLISAFTLIIVLFPEHGVCSSFSVRVPIVWGEPRQGARPIPSGVQSSRAPQPSRVHSVEVQDVASSI